MSLPCDFHDEANLHAGVFVSSAESIDYEKPLAGELFLSEFLASVPSLHGSLVVVVRIFRGCPPNLARSTFFGGLVVNDELVFR